MERAFHDVADLPDAVRTEIGRLLACPLRNEDVLYIAAIGARDVATAARRNVAWDEVESLMQKTQRHAARSGLSSEQIDALIDAECAAIRYDAKR
jgi:hypothetical protein